MSAMQPQRACPVCRILGCDDPTHTPAHREAQRKRDVAKRQRATYRPYDAAERREHRAMVRAWVDEHGWFCPGAAELGHLPHPVRPGELEVDHIVPVKDGGPRVGGAKRVLCRAMNRGRR